MEFYQEFLLTSLLSILIVFLIGKLAAADTGTDFHGGSGDVLETTSRHEVETTKTKPEDSLRESHDDMRKKKEKIDSVEEEKEEKEEEEEEWEGIERSELEKLFGLAMAYTGSEEGSDKVSKLPGDVHMKLYALQKVATEGPCFEPQPMALKLSARSKWNAWQKLGSMNPELAMEHYISLLSESIPGWMEGNTVKDEGENARSMTTDVASGWRSSLDKLKSLARRKSEDTSQTKGESATSCSASFVPGAGQSFLLKLLSPSTLAF